MSTFRVIDSLGANPISHGEWRHLVCGLKETLREKGVITSVRVLAWLPRGWQEAALCQATRELGGVWVSVPRRYHPDQVAALVADAESNVAVCTKRDLPRMVEGPWMAWPDVTGNPHPETPDVAAALAALCYTSGSTGSPKGVMVSHGNLNGAMQRVESYLHHTAQDRILSLMPLNSPWGLLQWRMAQHAGATIVLPPAIAMASEIAQTIRAACVTGLAALPPTWVQLVDYLASCDSSLPELRYVTTSGGTLPQRILDLFPTVFPNAEVWMTYGLTEAFRTTVLAASDFATHKGSLGKPCADVGLTLLKPDGTIAAPGETGELVHHGECVTLGYWKRPDLNEATFRVRPGHEPLFGNSRVHYSGDLVRMDEDGCLWFEGRNDGLLKSGGYRVSTHEIEDVLLAVPGIVHAVVGGVPDETLGQKIVAAVELASPEPEKILHAGSILRSALASHQQPHQIHVWPGRMPLNANGKIDRPQVHAWLLLQPV